MRFGDGNGSGNGAGGGPHDDFLDDEFPLGDGTADTEAEVTCPYCGETCEIAIDPGGGPEQDYIEDCQVCCQPWRVRVTYVGGGAVVTAEPIDS